MGKPYLASGGKPIFREIITPIGLIVHLYHDKPQLKTKDEFGNIPDVDPKTGIQMAEFKVTMAWSKTRVQEINEMVTLANTVKHEAWPESAQPGAFFALQPFFRDGDNPEHNTKNKDYLHGRYYLNFKSKAAPVLKQDGTFAGTYTGAPGLLGPGGPGHQIFPTDIYPGCTGRVSGIMFGTEYMGKHFISTRMNNLQLFEPGERIGGGVRPTADSQFGALTPGAGAADPMAGLMGGGAQQQPANPFGIGGGNAQPAAANPFGLPNAAPRIM